MQWLGEKLGKTLRLVCGVGARGLLLLGKIPSALVGLRYLVITDKRKKLSIGTFLERNAELFPDAPALLYEDAIYSHHHLNRWVNRYANYFLQQGFRHGDVVAVFMENRPELVVAVAALAKLGAVASLVNTNQRKDVLKHSFDLCRPKALVVGEELLGALDEVRAQLDCAAAIYVIPDGEATAGSPPWEERNLARTTLGVSEQNPPTTSRVALGDPCFYIYTSGTTGLPKASIMTHFRWVKACAGFGRCTLALKPGQVLYTALPLYHNNALTVGWSSVAATGAALAIRRRFSASEFWEDTRRFNAVAFCYIGELCRYLNNAPQRPDDAHNPVMKMIGNGLRPDLWKAFKSRFGIPEVYEFYAASEGNIAFINALNFDCTVGLCPFPYAIVEYDVGANAPVRDLDGRFRRVRKGEVGLLLGEVTARTPYDGYTSAKESDAKLFSDVFRKGDRWFNSGDLMRDLGFRHAQFVDRLGDTFRWKGENVSTTEVEGVLNAFSQVLEATVYGVEVEGADGRAGMAALVLNCSASQFDARGILQLLRERMPEYAVPRFLRVRSQLATTGTFKHQKTVLKEEGFDLVTVADPLFVLIDGKEYQPLTEQWGRDLQAGVIRI